MSTRKYSENKQAKKTKTTLMSISEAGDMTEITALLKELTIQKLFFLMYPILALPLALYSRTNGSEKRAVDYKKLTLLGILVAHVPEVVFFLV